MDSNPAHDPKVGDDDAEDRARYRVRLRNSDGSRTRTLNVAAPAETDASTQALEEAGSDWEVLEVKCLGESGSEEDFAFDSEESETELATDDLDDPASASLIEDEDLPAPQSPQTETRARRWDPDQAATVPHLDRLETSPVSEDVTEVASFDNELEDLLPMSQSRSASLPPSQVIETKASGAGYRVRISRGAGAIVWESRIEGDSMEAALESTRADLGEGWDVLSVAKDDPAGS